MAEHSVIGKPVTNVDSMKKARGVPVYTDDIKLPGMLYGKILRSKYPHARILSIDTSKAKRLTGVKAVITGRDIPPRLWGRAIADKPIFAREKVRYLGDEVAGVVAIDEDTAEEALELIEVDYEELPAVFDPVEAMQEGAPLIHERLQEYEHLPSVCPVPNSNICEHFKLRKGNVEEGFRESDFIFEDEFKSQPISPSPIEPLACIANVDADGEITVWSSTQSPYVVSDAIARNLGISTSKVEVVAPLLGGGFGLKFNIKGELACVVMSQFAGKPVKLVSTREDVLSGTTTIRQPTVSKIKTGVKKDGTIVARKITIIWDTGAYADMGPRLIVQSGIAGGGPYQIPNVWLDGYCVYTNNTIGGAMRGFGLSESTWAIESHMDMIADRLSIDPLEFRLKNALEEGSICPTGQVAHAVGLKECLQSVAEKANWSQKKREKNVGIGIACFHKPTATPTTSCAFVKLNQDASADILLSCVDMGQGSNTVMRQIVAEELGIPIEKINVSLPDTSLTPYDSSTTGSRTTFVMGNAVKRAAEDARREIFTIASPLLGVGVESLELRDGKVLVKGSPDKGIPLDKLPIGGRFVAGIGYPITGKGYYSSAGEGTTLDLETGQASKSSVFWMYGAHLVEIEADPETGQITVKKVIAAHNVGKAINPLLLEGQYEGGLVMGIGDALYEQVIWERGKTLNPSFTDYKIPTSLDIPEKIESIFIEEPHRDAPYGNIGIGEAVIIGVPAAVGNAVYDAIGVRIKELPITPEKVLNALKKKVK